MMTEETYGPYEGAQHYPTGSLWVSERENTPEAERDRFGLSPGEQERLKALLGRCDVVNNAATLITQHVPEGTGQREAVLEELEALGMVHHDEFGQYRRELGVPERGRPGARASRVTVTNW